MSQIRKGNQEYFKKFKFTFFKSPKNTISARLKR